MYISISMLRGINVSGHKKISMKELQKLYESLGLKNVRTYIQSGNVIFESSNINVSSLKRMIEQKIKTSFGFDVHVFIKTPAELQTIIKNNPFTKEDATKLHVTFLSDNFASSLKDELDHVMDKTEKCLISENVVYLFCPNGYGKTKLSNTFFERKCKLAATTRNWKTVTTLLELALRKI